MFVLMLKLLSVSDTCKTVNNFLFLILLSVFSSLYFIIYQFYGRNYLS